MAYTIAVKVSTGDRGERGEVVERRLFEEVVHRFRELLYPTFVYDPVKAREFLRERLRLIGEGGLSFHERMVLDRMYWNLRQAEYVRLAGCERRRLWPITD